MPPLHLLLRRLGTLPLQPSHLEVAVSDQLGLRCECRAAQVTIEVVSHSARSSLLITAPRLWLPRMRVISSSDDCAARLEAAERDFAHQILRRVGEVRVLGQESVHRLLSLGCRLRTSRSASGDGRT